MESLLIVIGLFVVAFVICLRLFIPKETLTELLAKLIHDALSGIWHLIFGPKKIRIDNEIKKVQPLKKKKRNK